MKKIIVLSCFVFLCLPAFAWNQKAADVSLQFLNNSVYTKVPVFNHSLYNDYYEITRIINWYKQNPELIKTKEINDFGTACIKRNQTLLSVYENEFFKPAYAKYLEFDKSMSFDDWKNSVAISETSLFYDFYTFTESNLRDCQKIAERSTNR